MKRLFFIGGFLFLGVIALSSCKKDWTCECTAGSFSSTTTIIDHHKKEAQTDCDETQKTVEETTSIATECTLSEK